MSLPVVPNLDSTSHARRQCKLGCPGARGCRRGGAWRPRLARSLSLGVRPSGGPAQSHDHRPESPEPGQRCHDWGRPRAWGTPLCLAGKSGRVGGCYSACEPTAGPAHPGAIALPVKRKGAHSETGAHACTDAARSHTGLPTQACPFCPSLPGVTQYECLHGMVNKCASVCWAHMSAALCSKQESDPAAVPLLLRHMNSSSPRLAACMQGPGRHVPGPHRLGRRL